jgi:antirestriction protein
MGHEEEAGHEAEPRDGPRLYVASLSDYVNGVLHGRWIDAVLEVETMQDEIGQMLAESPTARETGMPAEEWAIHDYDNFGPIRAGEYQALGTIASWVEGIGQYGQAYAAWIAHVADNAGRIGTGSEDGGEVGGRAGRNSAIEEFEEQYLGEWDSLEDYAETFLDDLGAQEAIDKADSWLQPYLKVDVSGFARDLDLGGDVIVVERPEGGVWVWRG